MDHQIQQLSRLGLKLQLLDTRVHKTPFVAITFEFSGMQIVHGLEPMSGPSYGVIRLRAGAVHAWSTRRPAGDVTLPFMIDWDVVENDERQHLSDRLAPWMGLYPDVDVTCVIDPDNASRALLRHAKAA